MQFLLIHLRILDAAVTHPVIARADPSRVLGTGFKLAPSILLTTVQGVL